MGRPKKQGLPSKSTTTSSSRARKSDLFDDSQIPEGEDEGNVSTTIVNNEPSMCKGAIVRLKLENFMTHKDVQFRIKTENTVNLVCGPNGTGKSAIVCAICIGLGGDASILGRSNQLHGYIRHGATWSTIEIELFNPDGSNFVITRRIKITKKGAGDTVVSDWKLNGGEADAKKVKEFVSSLNIQLNNLVTFMPQDRVQEFSKLNPQTLLKLTERAIDSEYLELTHTKLIEIQDEIAKRELDLAKMNKDMNHHGVLLQKLEEQVKAFHERADIVSLIKESKGKLVWITYVKVLAEFSKLKKEMEIKRREKENVEKKAKWLTDFMEKLKVKVRSCKSDIAMANREHRDLRMRDISAKEKDDLVNSLDKIEKIQFEYNLKRGEEEERVERKQSLEEDLKRAERALVQEQQKVNSTLDLENEIRGLREQQRRFVDRITDHNLDIDRDKEDRRSYQHTLTLAENNLERLKQQNNARFKFLETNFRDVSKAYEYFKNPENRKEFRGKLHDPMILNVEVNDVKYGCIVEANIGLQDLTAYFCENADDVGIFLEKMKRLGLRVSCFQHSLRAGWKPPTDRLDERIVKKFGFTKLLSDLIQTSDYYLSYLFDKQDMNQVPVGPDSLADKIDEIKKTIPLFYTTVSAVNSHKSSYSGLVCSTVNHLQKARIFTREINKEEIVRLEKTLAETKKQIGEREKSIAGRELQLSKLIKDKSSIEEKLRICDEKLNKVAMSKSAINKIKRKIAMNEDQKIDLEKIKAQIVKVRKESVLSNLQNLNGLVKNCVKFERNSASLYFKQGLVRHLNPIVTNLDDCTDTIKLDLEKTVDEFTTIDLKVKEFAMEAENKKSEAKQLTGLNEPPTELRNGEYDEEEINQNLITAKTKLGFLEKLDMNIIRDQEAKIKEMKKLARNKDSEQLALNESKAKREELKLNWFERLSSEVEKVHANFQNYFQTINCGGKVVLFTGTGEGENEDNFRNYGIKLRVKFRANEEFSDLSGWKQSGGERAISTALYILALQELTTVPFRVVDEINQGMDAINESKFYNLLTRVTQASKSKSQYFILTPKLLPHGMIYPEDLGFFFLLNGPHVLPSPSQSQSFSQQNANRSKSEQQRATERNTNTERVERKPRLINRRVVNEVEVNENDDSDSPADGNDENYDDNDEEFTLTSR